MQPTWFERDLPVLDAVVTMLEYRAQVSEEAIAEATGFDLEDVRRALTTLDETYVYRRNVMAGHYVIAVTVEARRAVGQWPTGESLVSQLVDGLTAAADKEPDPEQKSRLRQVAGLLGGAVRDLAVDIAGKYAERRMGLG